MGASKRRKSRKPKKKSVLKATPQLQKPKKTFKSFIKSGYGILAIVVTIIGLPIGIEWLINSSHKALTSPSEQWNEKNYASGILIPIHIINSYKEINFTFGSSELCTVPLSKIIEGVPFSLNCWKFNGSEAFELQAMLHNGLLYFSTKFYNLDGIYIGKMDFNNWEVKNDKISYYPSDDNSYLEIHDDRDLIIFQMRYIYPNTISFYGYFVDPLKNIVVFSQGMEINNKEYGTTESESEIKKIKSLSRKYQ